ncbi:tyrosine-type recombinase/integrase [Halomarina ordinaria]|uniref:Tyrosine-type recombinase/integrase n=1 Tax=Halomarina ordinaria TaxID=3033939 RepID=A0ABD5UIZ5_9EURY|nr:tyrosine-type recombinase/integrase [Halomarina sp. PSRA2]
MVEQHEDDGSPGGQPLEEAIEARLRSIDSGNYRRSVRSALEAFAEVVCEDGEIEAVDDVSRYDCRYYAQTLRDRAKRPGERFAASTAHKNYAFVRASFTWWQRDGRIAQNPAQWRGATDELPEVVEQPERQFWSKRDRQAILRYTDRQVDEALDGGDNPLPAFRDRAIVYTLALSGVRGAEVFRDPADDRREGLRWEDVDYDRGGLTVFGKTRTYQNAPLPSDAQTRLERYQRLFNPEEVWPVFPSLHRPSLYRTVREGLTDLADDRVEALLEENDPLDVMREYGLVPPALSVRGARSVMKRLCADADLDIDGEYLKPHGARRGLGHQLYTEGQAELAQEALRHQSVETTHQSYHDVQVEETARRVDDILNED